MTYKTGRSIHTRPAGFHLYLILFSYYSVISTHITGLMVKVSSVESYP